MFNDIVWGAKGNEETCKSNACEVANYARRFLRGHWSERSGTELTLTNLMVFGTILPQT